VIEEQPTPPISRKQAPGVLEPVPWGVASVIVVVMLAIGLFVSVLLTAAIIARVAGMHGHSAQVGATELTATIIFDLCIFGLALVYALSRRGMDLQVYGFRGFPLSDLYLPAIGIAGTYLILAIYVGAVTALHVPRLRPIPNIPEDLLRARNLIVPTALAACIIAPIVEETFFRGFVFRGLLGRSLRLGLAGHAARFRIRFWAAALLSGLLFALFHGELGLLIPFTCVGALFAWMFWRTGSLWPNILAHAGFNAVSLALALVTQR
jgi:membrane protease YdiL (CAAX protease family)